MQGVDDRRYCRFQICLRHHRSVFSAMRMEMSAMKVKTNSMMMFHGDHHRKKLRKLSIEFDIVVVFFFQLNSPPYTHFNFCLSISSLVYQLSYKLSNQIFAYLKIILRHSYFGCFFCHYTHTHIRKFTRIYILPIFRDFIFIFLVLITNYKRSYCTEGKNVVYFYCSDDKRSESKAFDGFFFFFVVSFFFVYISLHLFCVEYFVVVIIFFTGPIHWQRYCLKFNRNFYFFIIFFFIIIITFSSFLFSIHSIILLFSLRILLAMLAHQSNCMKYNLCVIN